MRPGTRMMMISSLGEESNENRRRMGFESERRDMRYPESREGYDRPEGGNGARGGYEAEGNYGPRNNGPQNAYDPRNAYEAEGGYRVRGRDDYERREPPMYYGRSEGGMEPSHKEDEREKGRRMEYRMEGEGRRRPMSHYGGEEDEDDMSGSFRSRKTKGHIPEEEKEELTDERVKKWVEGMQNSDGKSGERFPMDQAELLRANYCHQCDKLEFYGAINMIYSDYYEVAKRLNVDRPEFYACMAKAFLLDKDAGEGKLAKYIKYIAEK